MVNLKGECLCGAVSYEYNGDVGDVLNCHCAECRKWHGAAYRTRTIGQLKNFTWVAGKDKVSKFEGKENSIKSFCHVCGSNLVSFYKDNEKLVGLPIGAMEGADDLNPQCHIFVEDKANWHEITDNLPQHKSWPDNSEMISNVTE